MNKKVPTQKIKTQQENDMQVDKLKALAFDLSVQIQLKKKQMKEVLSQIVKLQK